MHAMLSATGSVHPLLAAADAPLRSVALRRGHLRACCSFRVEGLQGSGFRVQGSGFRVQLRVQGSGFRVQGS
eukprot:530488-Rhodomonas_salina.6